MASRADCYEFNAPKHFFDFTKGDIEVDESYFDTCSETPQKTPAAHATVSQSSSTLPAPEAVSPPPSTLPVPEAVSQSSSTLPVPEAVSQSSSTLPVPEAVSQSSSTLPVPEAVSQSSSTLPVPEAVSQSSSTLLAPKGEAVSPPPSSQLEDPATVNHSSTLLAPKAEAVSQSSTLLAPKAEAVSQSSTLLAPKTEAVNHSSTLLAPKTEAVNHSSTLPVPQTEAVSQPSSTQPPAFPETSSVHSPTSLSAPRSVPRKVSQAMAGLDTVGVRQSPRLAAIAKALRRNRAARKSIGKSGTRALETPGARARKRAVSRVTGVMGLSAQDEADLQAIATVTYMAANDTAASKPFQPTKPEEFHFATDSRLRGPWAAEEVAPVPVPVQPHSGPTRPKEFHFATEARAKVKEPAQGEEQEYVDFTRSLRSSSTSHKDAAVTRTVPQPFNLTESRRRNTEEPSKFVSVAEQNLMFHTKTPQRFRTKRAGDDIQEDAKRTKPNSLGITIPQTPQLFTTKRSRPVTYLTMEQIEEQEFEEAQKQTFKARPVSKKVLAPPPAALTVKKLPTVPEPFNITDTKKSVTKAEEEYGPADESSASIASSSHGGKKVATKQRPFSFDSRDKAKLHQKEEKIKKVIQEEKSLAEFHAQPMPSFVNGVLGLPPKKPPTPTKLQPFNLQADQRGAVKQERFKAQLEEESQEDAEQRKFRARPGSVVHKAPFILEKSQHPLTEISGFALNTEVRAGKRSEYDLQQKMHEEEITAAKKLEEERQAAEEAAEVAQQRQEAVHKANPMPKFKPVSFQLPQLPVTIPKSPKFATESRLRSKSRANSTMNISSATYTAE